MANPEALNIMLLSGDYSKIQAAAMLTVMGASYDKPVKIFVSMEALPAFHKDPAIAGTISQGPVAQKIVESGADSFIDLFRQAKEFGQVTIYACSLVMDLYHWQTDDLVDIVDTTLGIAGFLSAVEGEPTYTM
ncbi:MAG: DsrE/DsrF/DrsH-like family protein [Thermaerobacter sp.]|nr:DsrE/DsrF/DrsH-like family protein [Thermaerobacter sp.]